MSLGGKTTTTSTIDPDLKAASLAQLDMARRVGQLGFVPYQGATVAGMQPAQIAAMQNMNAGMSAFGLEGSPLPAAGDLSPYAMYQEQLARMAPGQRAFIESMFINPVTGAAPTTQFGAQTMAPPSAAAPAPVVAPVVVRDGGRGAEIAAERAAAAARSGGGGRSTTSMATPASYMPGGVNTRNPGSLANRVAAAATSKPAGPTAPTGGRAAKAPPSRPDASKSASKGGGSKGGGSKGGNKSGGRGEFGR